MNSSDKFRKFLRSDGRTKEVTSRVIRLVQIFAEFQLGRNHANLDRTIEDDLDAFIEFVDQEKEQLPKHDSIVPSAKSYLWAIRFYYQFSQNHHLETYASMLRQKRIKRKPFLLKDFRGANFDHITALASIDIKNTSQMLKAGAPQHTVKPSPRKPASRKRRFWNWSNSPIWPASRESRGLERAFTTMPGSTPLKNWLKARQMRFCR